LLGHIARLRGQTTPAIEHFQRAYELHEQTANLHGQATMHNQIANAYFDLSQWREADARYREARLIFERIGDIYLCAVADNNLGEIALYQGRLDEARIFYQQAADAMHQIGGSTYILGVLHMNLGHAFIRRGEIALAIAELQRGQTYFEQAQVRDFLPELHRHLAEAALQANDTIAAEAEAQQALALAQELEMRGEEGYALCVLGQINTVQGQYALAVTHLQQSLAIRTETGDVYESARTQLALAHLYHAQYDDGQARAFLERCAPVFEQLGATLDLADALALHQQL
jgi:tetratricopeptide (TPR) repeat protein